MIWPLSAFKTDMRGGSSSATAAAAVRVPELYSTPPARMRRITSIFRAAGNFPGKTAGWGATHTTAPHRIVAAAARRRHRCVVENVSGKSGNSGGKNVFRKKHPQSLDPLYHRFPLFQCFHGTSSTTFTMISGQQIENSCSVGSLLSFIFFRTKTSY